MGSTRYKVTYECHCGCDYGSCERRSVFLFDYNRSCDIGSLFHKRHADEPGSKMEFLGSFGDAALSALIKILTENEPSESWDQKDKEDAERSSNPVNRKPN